MVSLSKVNPITTLVSFPTEQTYNYCAEIFIKDHAAYLNVKKPPRKQKE